MALTAVWVAGWLWPQLPVTLRAVATPEEVTGLLSSGEVLRSVLGQGEREGLKRRDNCGSQMGTEAFLEGSGSELLPQFLHRQKLRPRASKAQQTPQGRCDMTLESVPGGCPSSLPRACILWRSSQLLSSSPSSSCLQPPQCGVCAPLDRAETTWGPRVLCNPPSSNLWMCVVRAYTDVCLCVPVCVRACLCASQAHTCVCACRYVMSVHVCGARTVFVCVFGQTQMVTGPQECVNCPGAGVASRCPVSLEPVLPLAEPGTLK